MEDFDKALGPSPSSSMNCREITKPCVSGLMGNWKTVFLIQASYRKLRNQNMEFLSLGE